MKCEKNYDFEAGESQSERSKRSQERREYLNTEYIGLQISVHYITENAFREKIQERLRKST